jgi:hypothetical protein
LPKKKNRVRPVFRAGLPGVRPKKPRGGIVSVTESIAWLESAIAHERAVAASWSLAGWPAEANYYRRNVLKAMRILRRVREVAP